MSNFINIYYNSLDIICKTTIILEYLSIHNHIDEKNLINY